MHKLFKKDDLFCLLFYVAIFLFYPLSYCFLRYTEKFSFSFSDLTLISIISTGFVLFKIIKIYRIYYQNKIFFTAFCLFLLLILFQSYIYHFNLDQIFFSFQWIFILLFAVLYSEPLKKYFDYYVILFLIFNLLYLFIPFFIYGNITNIEYSGLAGNRNWNASITIVCLVFSINLLIKNFNTLRLSDKYSKIRKAFIYICSVVLISCSIFILINCHSRSAYFSLILSCIFFLILHFRFFSVRKLVYSSLFLLLLLTFFIYQKAVYL